MRKGAGGEIPGLDLVDCPDNIGTDLTLHGVPG